MATAYDPTSSRTSKTPLERICALPEHIVDRELTANQERARFIGRDDRDYAEKAPAGLVIDSQTIKKSLDLKNYPEDGEIEILERFDLDIIPEDAMRFIIS